MKWREQGALRWLEAELPGARAAFSSRLGGVSDPPFDTLNLGLLTGDAPESVRENRHRLAGAVGVDPSGVLIGRQVHGAEVSVDDGPQAADAFANPGPRLAEVDGHATAQPGLAPLVFVADCLPIALAGPGGVAMVHGGWRGLAGGIVARGGDAVDAAAAAIGPGIGPCCYEVGQEVLDAFADLGEGVAEGRMLDLTEVARRLLARAGVKEVETSGLCVGCEPELFFSHRRDAGRTGRQAGMVWRWPS
jgi:polyphenol oxidase